MMVVNKVTSGLFGSIFRRKIQPTGFWTLVLRLGRWWRMSPEDRYLEDVRPLSVEEIESIERRHND